MKKNVIKSTVMLYFLSIGKLVFPLLTIPYISRVLSTDSYASVSYVKTVMTYMQIIIDFGFGYSGVRDIVKARENLEKTEEEAGDVILAKLLLSVVCVFALVVMIFALPILREFALYALLAFVPVFLTIFLYDFLFRGLEKMELISIRFVVMKAISTLLTFVFVKSDADVMWIPVLDIFASMIAIAFNVWEVKKLGIHLRPTGLGSAIQKLKESFIYFISDMATTAFGLLNTLLIGIFLSKADVAYWSNAMIIVNAIQMMYTPITGGLYPDMIRTKDFRYVRKMLYFFMPIIVAGCIFSYFFAPTGVKIAFGAKFIEGTTPVFRRLIPLLFLSFPAMVIGWPVLGAINKPKENTATTVTSSLFQIAGLILLGVTGNFNLLSLAVLRCITETVLLTTRAFFVFKYRNEFNTL